MGPVPEYHGRMKYYTYCQNNSFGVFKGPWYVIVEAPDADTANQIAERNGLYFNGIAAGIDCPCCGDRWHRAWEIDATDAPEIYGEPADPKIPILKGT